MEDNLDLILRWSIKDIYPELEPSPQVWQGIRGQLAEVRLSAGSLRDISLAEKLSLYLEKAVWQPFPPSSVGVRHFSEEYRFPLWTHGRAIPQLAL